MRKIISSLFVIIATQFILQAQCDFSAPTVYSVEVCQNVSIPDIIASTTETVDEWKWYEADGITPIVNNSAIFASGVNNAVAGTSTFYVSFLATDEVSLTQCESAKAIVTVIVNPLPSVSIDETKTVLCYDQGAEMIENTVTSSIGFGTAVWTVDGAAMGITSGGIFDPTFNGMETGTYVIGLTYTDGRSCVKSTTKSIDVQYTPPPTTISHLSLITQNIDAMISATGSSIKWYQNLIGGTAIGTGTPWVTGDQGDIEIPHPGKNYYASQTIRGCESQRTAASVILLGCPFMPPTVIGTENCVGGVLNNLTATKPVTMTEPVDEWRWYNVAVGGTPTPTAMGTYAHGISSAAAGTWTLYVGYVATETISGVPCESPRTPVTVIVNPLPTVTIDETKTVLCYDQGDEFIDNTTTSPNGLGTATWTVDGAAAGITSGGIFTPSFAGQVTNTYVIGLTYTDAKGCVKATTKSIDVQYSPAPTTISHLSLITQNIEPVLTATGDVGATFTWYQNLTGGTSLGTGSPWLTGDQGDIEIPSPGKDYYASQTIRGCESQRTSASVIVTSCPVPAPIVIQPAPICNYEQIPELTASISTWINGTRPTPTLPVEFRYYADAITPISITSNTTGLYTPTIDTSIAGTYTYYVAEYNPNVLPQACEGPRSAITVIVKKILPPTLLGAMDVCAAPEGTNPTLLANDIVGNVEWYETQPAYPAVGYLSMGSSYKPDFTAVGPHTVWAVNRQNGCASIASSTSFTIKSIPPAPAVTPNESCINDPATSVCATGTDITWYFTSNKTALLSESTCYTPAMLGSNVFYASQKVNGCESPTAPVQYTVKPRPNVLSSKNLLFDIGESSIIHIEDTTANAEITWYSDSPPTSIVYVGNDFPITNSNLEKRTYYITQTLNDCESGFAIYTICNSSVPQVNLSSATIQLPESLPTFICNTSLGANEHIWWKINEDTISDISSYTPSQLLIGDYELTMQIRNPVTGCSSEEIRIPITIIPCLPLPTDVSDTVFSMYLHETPPTFEVQQPNTAWLDANYNQIGTGSTYTPLISRTGTFTFYAQQTNGSCVSNYKPYIVTVQSYSISGKVFFDTNEDGIFQAENDIPVANQKLYIAETNESIGTNVNGDYMYYTDSFGTYTFSLASTPYNSEVIGSNSTIVTLNASNSNPSQINFRWKVIPIYDISVDVYTNLTPVVGRTGIYSFYIRNNGSKQYNIPIKVRYDNTKCTFKLSNLNYISQAAGEIDYILDSLETYSTETFSLFLDVIPDWTLTGQKIPIYIEANTTNVDITPSNNIDSLYSIIRNSSDPNDKAVTPSLLEEGYVLMNSTLEYRIRFQNKGTADAWDIYIKDTIDENLDISTFNLVASSHDVHYTIQNRVVTFYFDSIMLPSEMYDTLGSNGFVVYTIDPIADLLEEAQAFNTAHIFFDFNPAVVTNTTQSTYVTVLPKVDEEDEITDIEIETIRIAPNPVVHSTTICIAEQGEKLITITDARSKTIMKLSGTQNEFPIDCSKLSSGVYMCTIICNGKKYNRRIIVK